MSMTDTQKIELLRTELQRIQILRQAALANMEAALGSFELSQEQADAGIEGMRITRENIAAAKAALATLQTQETQVAQNLTNLQAVIAMTDEIAAPPEQEPVTEP